MNKEELVKDMAARAAKELGKEVSQKVANACLNAFMDATVAATERKEPIALVGFGTFNTAERAARKGRNPQTQKEIVIPAKVVPTFKAGINMKEAAAKPKKTSKKR